MCLSKRNPYFCLATGEIRDLNEFVCNVYYVCIPHVLSFTRTWSVSGRSEKSRRDRFKTGGMFRLDRGLKLIVRKCLVVEFLEIEVCSSPGPCVTQGTFILVLSVTRCTPYPPVPPWFNLPHSYSNLSTDGLCFTPLEKWVWSPSCRKGVVRGTL